MQPPKQLCLMPSDHLIHPDLEAAENNIRRFIGVAYDPSRNALVATGQQTYKPARKEYLDALLAGELLPGDKATADWFLNYKELLSNSR